MRNVHPLSFCSRLSQLRHCLGDEMGYCPQEDALDMYMTGKETLLFHARLRGFDSKQALAMAGDQLSQLQLVSLADKAVHTYSVGNRRKLALALAMLGDPPLLLLVSASVVGQENRAGTKRRRGEGWRKCTGKGEMMGEAGSFVIGGWDCHNDGVQHIFSQHSGVPARHFVTGTLGLADGFSLFLPISCLFMVVQTCHRAVL